MTQDNIRRKLAASPCIRIPLRNIFPAAYINNIDVRITKPHPKNGCQRGILTGAPSLSSNSIGVAGGNSDMAREKVLSGSRITFVNTNKGAITSTITGIIALCASRISFTAAPMEINRAPNIRTAKDWNTNNQIIM